MCVCVYIFIVSTFFALQDGPAAGLTFLFFKHFTYYVPTMLFEQENMKYDVSL